MDRIGKESRKLFVILALVASGMCADKAMANDNFPQEGNCCGQNVGNFAANDCFVQESYCCDQNEGKVFLRGDVLYWRPYLSGIELNFGTASIVTTTMGNTQIIDSREFDTDPCFDWDAGFRIAGGYATANSWGIGVDWTHFDGNGHHRSFYNGDITSHGKFKVKLDQVDLVLGYDYAFSCDFNVKPFIGVRGARINDSVRGLITTQLTVDDVLETGEIRHFHYRQDYTGVGLLLGLQADYNLGCGIGVYGTAAGSLLYGKYRVKFDDATSIGALSDYEIFTRNRRHLYSFDPNIDLALGLFWKTNLFECAQLSMKLGFEHHEYFNQNHLSVFRGDVSFTGGIFSIDIAL